MQPQSDLIKRGRKKEAFSKKQGNQHVTFWSRAIPGIRYKYLKVKNTSGKMSMLSASLNTGCFCK